ncbi:TolC family protein [bacterium]|nr:TolC family protein [bacterium]
MQRISALLIGVFLVFICLEDTPAQEMPAPVQGIVPKLSIVDKTDEVEPSFAINLPVAMQLANARPLDIAIAGERITAAQADLLRAKALWLPTLNIGTDYLRSDGQIQEIKGKVFGTSKSAFMVGLGPTAVFALSDAIYKPLAAKQVVKSREADKQAAINDSLLTVAESYFKVQEARGDVASALDTVKRSEELAEKTRQLSAGLAPPAEASRVRAELARRKQDLEYAYEAWQVQSDPARTIDELIPIGLTLRPELASQQALVQASIARLQQEKMRPLIPSILLRGAATNPGGTLSSGLFGGGNNGSMADFGMRNSMDLQVLWELESFGIGNIALKRERQAQKNAAALELYQVQDRVAADVVAAHAQTVRTTRRIKDAEEGLQYALDTADKNAQGLSQTRRIGDTITLVFRPQEVLVSIQSLQQAYRDYYKAITEHNRAQFRLYRALGHPGQQVGEHSVVLKPKPSDKEISVVEPVYPSATIERVIPLPP